MNPPGMYVSVHRKFCPVLSRNPVYSSVTLVRSTLTPLTSMVPYGFRCPPTFSVPDIRGDPRNPFLVPRRSWSEILKTEGQTLSYLNIAKFGD